MVKKAPSRMAPAPDPASIGPSFRDRMSARLTRVNRRGTDFTFEPEPRLIGDFDRGKKLLSGKAQLGGQSVQVAGKSIWKIDAPSAAFLAEAHGFLWLDDLAAIGNVPARGLAQDWLREWLAGFGGGSGPGWTPELTGRRLIRLICHGPFLIRGLDDESRARFFRALTHQTAFLARRWSGVETVSGRIEALTGLLYAGLCLEGMDQHVFPAMQALGRECAEHIDEDGALASRNPEALMEILSYLAWGIGALAEAGQAPVAEITAVVARIVPTLRALRHADGGLVRAHGGGRGKEGRLDHALAQTGVKSLPRDGLAMGFLRMQARRTTLIADVATPPDKAAVYTAHASALAFELTSGRRPVIVSCGSGRSFGPEWTRMGRLPASHSTLEVEGASATALVADKTGLKLVGGPGNVDVQRLRDAHQDSFTATHDAFSAQFGLTHQRKLTLSADGRVVTGEDSIGAFSERDKMRFEKLMSARNFEGMRFHIRFHLHPDVKARIGDDGDCVLFTLQNGETWIFSGIGQDGFTIEDSLYLQDGQQKPRAAKQVVLSGAVMEYASQVSWTLEKAEDVPDYMRDLDQALELTS